MVRNEVAALSYPSPTIFTSFSLPERLHPPSTPRSWADARHVISSLAPLIVDLDDDGVALYLFSTTMVKAQGIANEAVFDDIFSKTRPVGTSVKMAPAIDAAFKDFFARSSKQGRACSILVITAGEPADLRQTTECLVPTLYPASTPAGVRDVETRLMTDMWCALYLGAEEISF